MMKLRHNVLVGLFLALFGALGSSFVEAETPKTYFGKYLFGNFAMTV